MNAILEVVANPMFVYLAGMAMVVVLALVFSLSIRYYAKAKDLAPHLRKIEELEKRKAELDVDIEERKKERKELLAELTKAETTIQQGKIAEQWLKDHKSEIEEAQRILAKLHEEIEKAKVNLEDLEGKISERQRLLAGLEQKVVDAGKAIEDLRKENGELTGQVPCLRAEKASLENEIKDLKALKEERDSLAAKIESLKETKSRLDVEIKTLETMKQTLEDMLDKIRIDIENGKRIIAEGKAIEINAQNKWKNLDTPVVVETSLRKANESTDEKKWLDDFGKSLKQHGFIFDERTIRAFHTGLKCATQTPLVVLSGISGTGKSLLPELYSAALGANFLSVPVQPRWDSPQDLFGFYNYMEGRYKATELARLLWQFDIFNNPAAKKWEKNGLPLNLVLLDEMNIARVEYYFSDLLSKLETRNGIDALKDDERRKAEIELECNAADDATAMRRLFVSPHTLFVGTMNEDESTQMLSDKVIDRSNVLRFGRPGILGQKNGADEKELSEPNKSKFVEDWRGQSRVTASMWDKWRIPLSKATDGSDAIKFLHDTLLPVGEALDIAGRAYGFRVDQAMKLYVLNYPGAYREAVSDQIEMKILPKLNGMELQNPPFAEVKTAMSDAIGKTKDAKLQQAFEEASRTDTGATFFKWRGVQR